MKTGNKLSHSYLLIAVILCLAGGCTKPSEPLQTGTVTDVEGNVYATVKIGHQWWMAENLKTRQYKNGSAIQEIQSDAAQWIHDTIGAYSAGNFGLLYNWYAVHNNKKLAPTGWHIPTDNEWKELEKNIGMSATDADKMNWRGTNEGEKLKMTGTENWQQYPDVWATNETGFSALAGNCRLFNGFGGDPFGSTYTGFWWTATENTSNQQSWYRYLDYKKANVFRYYGPKTYGFSIRCVKD